MSETTCDECGATHARKRSRYCSKRCWERVRDRKRYAADPARRKRRGLTRLTSCAWCLREFQGRAASALKYCSTDCASAAQERRVSAIPWGECERCSSPLVARCGRRFCSLDCQQRTKYEPHGWSPVRYGFNCTECGKQQYATHGAVATGFCSTACSRRAAKRRYRHSRRLNAGVKKERFTLREIAERDGWRCHLCGHPVKDKPWANTGDDATLDHLVPVSAGGDHVRSNVALAHNACNYKRGANGEVQLLLVG